MSSDLHRSWGKPVTIVRGKWLDPGSPVVSQREVPMSSIRSIFVSDVHLGCRYTHADALLQGEVSVKRIWQMGLTYLVPYCVSTYSSVSALRSLQRSSD